MTSLICLSKEDLNRISNPHGMHRKKNVIRDTVLGEVNTEEDASNHAVVKYIDDVNVVERVDLNQATDYFSTRKQVKEVRAKECEAFFDTVKTNAGDLGMVINTAKTQSICISHCTYYEVNSIVNTDSGQIRSADSLKILGFVFGTQPNASEHIKYTIAKFNRCSWSLTHLKRAGLTERSLVDIYTSSLRPVVEYCNVVYHSLLTTEQGAMIERLQKRVLKIIFGFELSYEELLEKADIKTLEERRMEAVEKFALKMSKSERFGRRWFPRWENEFDLNLREEKQFIEYYARTSRLYNSQLYHMRRTLNQMLAR